MDQDLAILSVDVEVDQHVFIDLVMIEQIVRIDLISPFGGAGIGVASEDCRRPQIVAWPLVRIPGARVCGAVIVWDVVKSKRRARWVRLLHAK